jgi:hypothetical protein
MKKRNLLFILLLVILSSSIYLYTQVNRKPPDLSKEIAAFHKSAGSFIQSFERDHTMAQDSFLSQIIEVEGSVINIEGEQLLETIVLGDSASQTSIRLSMDSIHTLPVSSIKKGDLIRIKGVCIGYNEDDMGLGSDILLNKSVIIKKP